MVRTKSRPESFSVALAFQEVEPGLEERARFEVEVVGEWVVQCTLDTGLVGVVGAFERCWCAGENGRAIEDDCCVQFGTVCGGYCYLCCQASMEDWSACCMTKFCELQ